MKFFVGLDLGQSHDPSAIAVIEADYGYLTVRHLERAPLGTPHPEVVQWVKDIVRSDQLLGKCGLAVDGTGVGGPVVDMLRAAQLGCDVTDVRITAGDRENDIGSTTKAPRCSVPKRDLIAGLQVAIANRDLRIASRLEEAERLAQELLDLKITHMENGRVRMGADGCGEHDDLAIAVALAVWRSRRAGPGKIHFGHGRLF